MIERFLRRSSVKGERDTLENLKGERETLEDIDGMKQELEGRETDKALTVTKQV